MADFYDSLHFVEATFDEMLSSLDREMPRPEEQPWTSEDEAEYARYFERMERLMEDGKVTVHRTDSWTRDRRRWEMDQGIRTEGDPDDSTDEEDTARPQLAEGNEDERSPIGGSFAALPTPPLIAISAATSPAAVETLAARKVGKRPLLSHAPPARPRLRPSPRSEPVTADPAPPKSLAGQQIGPSRLSKKRRQLDLVDAHGDPAHPITDGLLPDKPVEKDKRTRRTGQKTSQVEELAVAARPPRSPPVEDSVLDLDSDPDVTVVTSEKASKNDGDTAVLRPHKELRLIAGAAVPFDPPTATAGKRKRKPRPSLEDEVTLKQRLREDKLTSAFPRIYDYAAHLSTFASAFPRTGKYFAGCRILVLNAFAQIGPGALGPDRLDEDLKGKIGVLMKGGAEIVPPAAFVPSPSWATDRDDPGVQKAAEEQGWTTHVVTGEIKSQVPTFETILGRMTLAGSNEWGVRADQLGPYVQFVRFAWASTSVLDRERQPEFLHLVEGSARLTPDSAREPSTRHSRQQQEREEQSDAEEAEADVRALSVSPLNPTDWPEGEQPPADYFAAPAPAEPVASYSPIKQRAAAALPVSDDSATTADHFAIFEGLDEQLAQVRSFAAAGNLGALDAELQADAPDHDAEVPSWDVLDPERQQVLPATDRDASDVTDEEGQEDPSDRPRLSRTKPAAGYVCDQSSAAGKARSDGPNEECAAVLEMLAKIAEDQWRERGYRMAAGALRRQNSLIDTFEKARAIRGIGARIATKIVEIVKTGTHRKLGMRTERDRVVKDFQGIYGVGPAKAEALYVEHQCRSLADVRKVPGLSDAQQLGLRYYDDLAERIPRSEVQELYQKALDIARDLDPSLQVHCMGSFRRGQSDCGDIDLLVSRDTSDGSDHSGKIKKFWGAMIRRGLVKHTLSSPEKHHDLDAKYMGLAALPGGKMRRIDVLGVPWDELGAALLYFTGNDFFNRSMRLKARHMGMRLNQRGLYRGVMRGAKGVKLTEGVRIDDGTEEDIMAKLKVPWRPPNERLP